MHSKVYEQSSIGRSQRAIVSLMQPESSVLEVGCATGHMTRVLSESLRCRVTAIEIDAQQASTAERYTHRMIVGDITDQSALDQAGGGFDYIIFADVLEHLVNPWDTLRHCRSALADGGSVLSSIPNIAYYKIRKQLLLGRFDYTRFGILDDSHLRFFTAKTSASLFTNCGYEIDRFMRVYEHKTDSRLRWLCPDAFAYQFVIRARAAEE